MVKLFLTLIISCLISTQQMYSQINKYWKTSADFFLTDIMLNIDSTELENSVNFQIHREHNLKEVFSKVLMSYFNSKNDTLSNNYISAKHKLFHFFDIGEIELSSLEGGLKIYVVKFNSLNDTSNLVYVIYDRFKREIVLYEANNFYADAKNISIDVLFDCQVQYSFLSKLISNNEIQKFIGKSNLKCYPFLVPLSNNKLLSLIYYTEDSNKISKLKFITVNISSKKIM